MYNLSQHPVRHECRGTYGPAPRKGSSRGPGECRGPRGDPGGVEECGIGLTEVGSACRAGLKASHRPSAHQQEIGVFRGRVLCGDRGSAAPHAIRRSGGGRTSVAGRLLLAHGRALPAAGATKALVTPVWHRNQSAPVPTPDGEIFKLPFGNEDHAQARQCGHLLAPSHGVPHRGTLGRPVRRMRSGDLPRRYRPGQQGAACGPLGLLAPGHFMAFQRGR